MALAAREHEADSRERRLTSAQRYTQAQLAGRMEHRHAWLYWNINYFASPPRISLAMQQPHSPAPGGILPISSSAAPSPHHDRVAL